MGGRARRARIKTTAPAQQRYKGARESASSAASGSSAAEDTAPADDRPLGEAHCQPRVATASARTNSSGHHHTAIGTERGYGTLGLSVEFQLPGLVCLLDRLSCSGHGHVVLTSIGLAIEDEERCDAVGLPLVQVFLDVVLDARQAAEGGQERLVVGRVVEEELEVVGRVYGDGTVLDLREIMGSGVETRG